MLKSYQESMIRDGESRINEFDENLRFLKIQLQEEMRQIELLRAKRPEKRNLDRELVDLQVIDENAEIENMAVVYVYVHTRCLTMSLFFQDFIHVYFICIYFVNLDKSMYIFSLDIFPLTKRIRATLIFGRAYSLSLDVFVRIIDITFFKMSIEIAPKFPTNLIERFAASFCNVSSIEIIHHVKIDHLKARQEVKHLEDKLANPDRARRLGGEDPNIGIIIYFTSGFYCRELAHSTMCTSFFGYRFVRT